jgi:uncharacterized membrane protein
MLKMLLALHIAGGSAALLSMMIPIVTRKGGRAHRRAGWIFVAGMALVSVTALILSAWRFFFDEQPGVRTFALFLFYIAILTAAGVSTGIRVLRVRHRSSGPNGQPRPSAWDLGLSALLFATSIGMAAYGVVAQLPLLAAFSLVGIVSSSSQLAYWLRTPKHRMHWWFEHMGSMLGSSIAATTAFLVVNADRFGAAQDSLVVWLAPTIVGTPLIAGWTAYYRRKFATLAEAPRGTSISAPAAAPYTRARTS